MTTMKKYSFLIVYLLVPLPLVGFYLGGAYNFLTFLILFSLIPAADYFFKDSQNPDTSQLETLKEDAYFKWIVLAYVPVQILILGISIYLIHNTELSWLAWIGFCSSVGLITGGMGINLSHELMHKRDKLQQFASKVLLTMVCYGHFFIEHIRGHHLRVATPSDPATARFGESFYQFLPRTLLGSFLSAWDLEKRRMQRHGHKVTNIRNQFWWIISGPLVIIIGLFMYGGINTVAFFLIQSFVAILSLEIVNYTEHYGLERKMLGNGKYERVNHLHSWNANHWLSNVVLFHLQRHSDHHANGGKPYQLLCHVEESPQLPSGYSGMMVLALIPPLWRAVMDPRVQAHNAKIAQREHSAPMEGSRQGT